MKDITIKISNMTCNGCIKSIKENISSKLESIDIDLITKIGKLQYDENTISEEEILRYLDLFGYPSEKIA